VVVLAFASLARAGVVQYLETASLRGDGISFTGKPGERNDVSVTLTPRWDALVFKDSSNPIVAGDPAAQTHCVFVLESAACQVFVLRETGSPDLAYVGFAGLFLGDGDDVVRPISAVHYVGDHPVTLGRPLYVEAGPGNDLILGDDAFDDIVIGGPGADQLHGGSSPTHPRYEGDTVRYDTATGPVTVTLDGQANDGEAGEADNVYPDFEQVVGSDFADLLSGSNAHDDLSGRNGDDTIAGLGGEDWVWGNNGDDTIDARDGERDLIGCGVGNDTVLADAVDQVSNDCENLVLN
jgi:Ca2+-binding RTX toxin-like protein